jgi:F-type H+-transporting ATPase subunit a
MASDPLDHVVQHPIKEMPLDAGALTPNGVVTLLSDHIAMIILSGVLLCLLLPWALRRRQQQGVEGLVATGFANFIEVVCEFLRKQVAEPALEHHTDRFIKYIWSVFFFVLTMNLLGLVPLGVITPLAVGYHIGGTATANIWVTGTLALMTLGMMVVNGLRLGGVEYLWMAWLMVPVEIAGWLAKIFALAIRLFANMLAGHLILAVLLGLIMSAGASSAALGFGVAVPVVLGSVALSMLEIFVAFLQAFIFALLTTLFIGMSVVFHHDEHEEATAH